VARLFRTTAAQVNEYRAFTIGDDGHITSSRAFVCESDEDATVWAKQLIDGHDIELWSGERFVTWLGKPSRTEQAREVVEEYANDLREIQKEFRRKLN